jgi:hypothetical protein
MTNQERKEIREQARWDAMQERSNRKGEDDATRARRLDMMRTLGIIKKSS